MKKKQKIFRFINWSLFFLMLVYALLVFFIPQVLPTDQISGDLSSFYHNGFYVTKIFGNPDPNGIQINDRIFRMGDCSIDSLLLGNCENPPLASNNPVLYKINRNGTLIEIIINPRLLTAQEMRQTTLVYAGPFAFCVLFALILLKRPEKSSLVMRVTLQVILFGSFFVYQAVHIPISLVADPVLFRLYIGLIGLVYSAIFANGLQLILVFPKEVLQHRFFTPFLHWILFLVPPAIVLGLFAYSGFSVSSGRSIIRWASMFISAETVLVILIYLFHFLSPKRPLTKIRLRWVRLFGIYTVLFFILFIAFVFKQTHWLENYRFFTTGGNFLSFSDPYLFFFLLIPILLAAVIPQTRILDIHNLERYSIFYGVAVVVLVSLFFFLYWIANLFDNITTNNEPYLVSLLAAVIAFIITGVAYQPFTKMMDRWFYHDQYVYEQSLPQIFLELNQKLTINQISDLLLNRIPATLEIESTSFLMKDNSSSTFYFIDSKGNKTESSIPANHPLPDWLLKNKSPILRFYLAPRLTAGINTLMKQYQIEVTIPLLYEGELIGIYNLNGKKNGRPYTLNEIELLNDIGKWAATAVHNIGIMLQKDDYSKSLELVVRQRNDALNKAEDVTKQERKERRSEQQNRSNLFGDIMQDLRSPLTVIDGMSSMVGDTRLNEKHAVPIKAIRESSFELVELMDHVFQYTLQELGNFETHPAELVLRTVCEAAIDQFYHQNATPGKTIIPYLTAQTPVSIITDPDQLQLLLSFLCRQTLSYSTADQFTLMIDGQPWQPGDEDGTLRAPGLEQKRNAPYSFIFTVKPEYPPRAPAAITTAQADSHQLPAIASVLADQTCQMLGGKFFEYDSSHPDQPASFHILAEIPPNTYPAFLEVDQPLLKHQKVFILDHEENSRRRLVLQCESWGMDVIWVDSAQLQVQHTALKSAADIVILNCEHPAFDTFDISVFYTEREPYTVLLRSKPGQLFPHTNNIARESVSPTAERLYELLTKACMHRPRPGSGEPKSVPVTKQIAVQPFALRILLCNMKPYEELTLRLQLELLGYQPEVFSHNLDHLPQHLSETHFDLVILELVSREELELSIIQRIRAEAPERLQPILLTITTNPVRYDRMNASTAGADFHLVKPFGRNELPRIITKVNERINMSRPTRRRTDS